MFTLPCNMHSFSSNSSASAASNEFSTQEQVWLSSAFETRNLKRFSNEQHSYKESTHTITSGLCNREHSKKSNFPVYTNIRDWNSPKDILIAEAHREAKLSEGWIAATEKSSVTLVPKAPKKINKPVLDQKKKWYLWVNHIINSIYF